MAQSTRSRSKRSVTSPQSFASKRSQTTEMEEPLPAEEELLTAKSYILPSTVRLKAPVIWARHASGLRFEDLTETRIEDAVGIIKKCYIKEDVLCRMTKVSEDPEALSELLYNCREWMKDRTSIAAIEEGPSTMAGVMIMRAHEKVPTSTTLDDELGIRTKKIKDSVDFCNILEGPINLYERYGVKIYLRVYLIGYQEEYNKKGIAVQFLNIALAYAKTFKIPVVSSIITTAREQAAAKMLGFEVLNEIKYADYQQEGQVVFAKDDFNPSAGMLAKRIEFEQEIEELIPERKGGKGAVHR